MWIKKQFFDGCSRVLWFALSHFTYRWVIFSVWKINIKSLEILLSCEERKYVFFIHSRNSESDSMMSERSARVRASHVCCYALLLLLLLLLVLFLQQLRWRRALQLMNGISSSASHCSMISSRDISGTLSTNSLIKRLTISKLHTSGWPEKISASHSSGVVVELEVESGIESNSIVSSPAGEHNARALCRWTIW